MEEYENFSDLTKKERENIDFRVSVTCRDSSSTVVLAPHGGGIEPGTSEIAREIAGDDFSFADFAGIKSSGNARLHLTSTNFDEPRCLKLVHAASEVLAIHGEESARPVVFLGGKDHELGARIGATLIAAGFTVQTHQDPELQGVAAYNICNRGRTGAGVQLELSRGLRALFFENLKAAGRKNPTSELPRFASAIRQALHERERLASSREKRQFLERSERAPAK